LLVNALPAWVRYVRYGVNKEAFTRKLGRHLNNCGAGHFCCLGDPAAVPLGSAPAAGAPIGHRSQSAPSGMTAAPCSNRGPPG